MDMIMTQLIKNQLQFQQQQLIMKLIYITQEKMQKLQQDI